MDEIIEISKKEPLAQDELLQALEKITLHPPEEYVDQNIWEPLLSITTAIHQEFEQISKSILFCQKQIDLEVEAFERVIKTASGGLKAHVIYLKRSEDISRHADELYKSTKSCSEKMNSTLDKVVKLQPNLPLELAITNPKMIKRYPALANFLKTR
jgi:hypothetical protein